MAVDTPATIAILGAGPIGIETALYARFLGYDVNVYEQGEIADSVLRWGHVRMFSPFAMNRSPLGLAALAAQDDGYQPPRDDALLTGREWVEQYLLPLANSDLLAGHIHSRHQVIGVGRAAMLKGDRVGDPARADEDFQILIHDHAGNERRDFADVVIDTSGVFAQPNWLGAGGIPAVGESSLRDKIEHGLPDLLGNERSNYAGRHTLVIGGGYSAATNVVALAELARQVPDTRVTWVTRNVAAQDGGPIPLVTNDRLAAREELARMANQIALEEKAICTHASDTVVEAIEYDADGDRFSVALSGRSDRQLFDRIIANVGFRGDWSITQELQLHRCYASDGPMRLAAVLLGQASADCLDQTSQGPQSLVTPEPNFYVLGAKSYGRNSRFLVSVGLEQIRDVFTIIGGRENLDLYANIRQDKRS